MISGYKESLQTFRDLLEQENLDEGLNNEYVRGGVELLADMFGVEGVFHAERIDQVLADLRAIGKTNNNSHPLSDWCIARLQDAREGGEIDEDTPDEIIEREAARLEVLCFQLASSFVDNEFEEN